MAKSEVPSVAQPEENLEYEKAFLEREGIDELTNEIEDEERKMESEIKRRSKGKTPEYEAVIRRTLESYHKHKTAPKRAAVQDLMKERDAKLDTLVHKVKWVTTNGARQAATTHASEYAEYSPDVDMQRAYARAALEPLKQYYEKLGFKARVVGREDEKGYHYGLVVNCHHWVPDAVERLRTASPDNVGDIKAVIKLDSGVDIRLLFPSVTDEELGSITGSLVGASTT